MSNLPKLDMIAAKNELTEQCKYKEYSEVAEYLMARIQELEKRLDGSKD